MKTTMLTFVFGMMMAGSGAFALTADEVISDFQSQGFTRTEVWVGPTQIKVEGIRGTEKVEVIYDRATGQVLKTETELVSAGENTAPGVSVRERNRDFVRVVRVSRSDDSASDDNGGERSRSRSDDSRVSASSSDDNGGDRTRDNSSSDDAGDDDHGSGHGRGADDNGDHGDDHGGSRGDDRNDDHGDDHNDDHGDDHGDDHDSDDD
jgi:hypothetical protein